MEVSNIKKDTITAKSESFKDNTTVGFKSFEDIRQKNEERLKNINDCNNGLRSSGNYQPTITEEMKLNGDSDSQYVGKGQLWRELNIPSYLYLKN